MYLHTAFYIPSSIGETESEINILHCCCVVWHSKTNCLHKSCILVENLLPYTIEDLILNAASITPHRHTHLPCYYQV
jgi:hypothetical protein